MTDKQLDMTAIEARLAAALAPPPFNFEAWQILHGRAPADLRALVAEVRRLRQDDAIWEKHGLTQIVTERNGLRDELDAIRHAAHMPDDYEHGLPSWINQHLYGKLVEWTDRDGGPIRRNEDIEEVRRLHSLLETEQHAKRAAEQDKQHWQEEVEQLQEELDVTDFLLDARNKIMNAIPECPDHGSQCVPHALAWIEKQVTQLGKVKQLRAMLGRNRQEAEDDAIRLQDANHQAQTEIEQLRLQVAQLAEALEGEWRRDDCE